MACPKCESPKVSRGERGLITDQYYCNECGLSYEKITPFTKKVAIGLGLTILIGPAGLMYVAVDG